MRDFKISLADAKNDQAEFKSNLNEIKKGNKKHRSKEQKKMHCIILKCFTMKGTVLLNFLMKKNKKLYNNRIKSIQRNSIEL